MPSKRIMIVDDQRDVSRLLQSALSSLKQDLKIVEMPSGEEAILEASRSKVDLLVADYRLPGITGIQLMKKIRALHPSARVILITGMTDMKVRAEISQAGAEAVFIKPIAIAEFLDTVERFLGLADTLLPFEPILKTVEDHKQPGLADQFSELRKKLNAQAVLLLNDRGRILACAGELPEKEIEASLVTTLMAVFNASQKVAQLLGHNTNSSWHIFDGGENDLLLFPLDSTHAIMLAGNKLTDEEVIVRNVSQVSAARQAIEASLIELEGPIIPYIKEKPVEIAIDSEKEVKDEDLLPLLKVPRKKIKTDELEAFWNDPVEGQSVDPFHVDGLTFDQARKLGLTPEEGQV